MAKLSFQEKQLIERVFGMVSGYVLNFSNREFEEFMKDVVSYNIYQKYPGLSKAKMLRRFIEDESDAYVGKMIILLINYMKSNSLDKNITQEDIVRLYEFGQKKLGKDSISPLLSGEILPQRKLLRTITLWNISSDVGLIKYIGCPV